jgi:hypothetical protein
MSTRLPDKDSCRRYKELIQKRLDGEITPPENIDLNEHLADCDDCREEFVSYLTVQSLVQETIEDPVEVPEGFFEAMAEKLEEVKPVRGFALIFSLPIFATHRNVSLAAASFVLVAILSLSVIQGLTNPVDTSTDLQPGLANSHAFIQTNRGDNIILPGDNGNSDRYSAALDDLEKAYAEARGQDTDSSTQGYIHTSYRGGESATPIH